MTSSISATRTALEAVRSRLEGSSGPEEKSALAEAYFRLAVLPNTGVDESIEFMRRALRIDPFHPRHFFHLARLLHNNGDSLEAAVQYCEGLKLTPRSHRIFVHLAMSLVELGGDEQKLGERIVQCVAAGDDSALGALANEVEVTIARRFGETRETRQEPMHNQEPSKGKCRWRGVWKLMLLHEMAKAKPSTRAAAQHMEKGKALICDVATAAEFALAGLFFIVDGPKTCRQVEGWLSEPVLAPYEGSPAVRLVRSACTLGEARDVADFVERASGLLTQGEIPPELVCSLHYGWYGANASKDAARAIAAVNGYPEPFQSLHCFRELCLALLDEHARAEWTADRVDRAEILWQETIRLDPFRIDVAHNLAIAATRAEATEKYGSVWDKAEEVRYLLAASARDVRLCLEDRIRLHQSFSRQSQLRFVPEGTKMPSDEQLQKWMSDGDALAVWLRQGELAYLNSRLRFRSPVCLLGIGQDCSDEEANAALKCLKTQFALCLGECRFSGRDVFLSLVNNLAGDACKAATDPLQRKRDPYVDGEMDAARNLGIETFHRGFLMYRMLKAAARDADLALPGLEIARYLLNMPWQSLEPLAKKNGLLEEDTELIPVFLSYVQSLALGEQAAGDGPGLQQKLRALKDCVEALPDELELRLVLCRLYLDGGRNKDAYQAALEALPQLEKMPDRNHSSRLEGQFVTCIDNAAFAEIPDEVLSPSRDQVRGTIERCGRVLRDFPRAGGLRLMMAKFLIQTAEDEPSRLAEAATLLEQGLDLFLTGKQIAEARHSLEKAGSRSNSIEYLKKIRSLMESASTRARAAVKLAAERTDANERIPSRAREAREELETAMAEAEQAREIAEQASLPDAELKARSLVQKLQQLKEEIEKG